VVRAIAAIPLTRRSRSGPRAGDEDLELLERLQAGDADAFQRLVARHHASMLRLACSLVSSRAVAEEVVQDTWLGVVRGIDRFAGRSTLRTWLLAILVNRARSAAALERRSVAIGDAGPVVDRARFDSSGAWSSPPQHWTEASDERMLAQALAEPIRAALEGLPPRQRQVVTLRDVDGMSAREVCHVLSISEGNQRVLLHRGRSRLRSALEAEMEGV
jgi:RNA polymerase sigma-70 factor, ECF subfamily